MARFRAVAKEMPEFEVPEIPEVAAGRVEL
jgi:hypothetical protein